MKKYLLWFLTVAWAVLIFYLTSIPNLKVSDDSLLSLFITSIGHFLFFGVQAALLYFALDKKVFNLPPLTLPLTMTSLYGALIELAQRGIPGRSADPMDWLLDTLGAAVFVAIINQVPHKTDPKG